MTTSIPPTIPGLTQTQSPSIFDLTPNSGFMKKQLLSRNPLLGYQEGIRNDVPSVLTGLTADASYRKMITCKNDLRVKVLRAPKDKFIVHNSLKGVGRNEQSIFPKPRNDHSLLIPADSHNISLQNKLGLPK
tara:strand:+ start:681 stop:1076 length:396 start_codon:yes stop_codon:yes gene_type:complete